MAFKDLEIKLIYDTSTSNIVDELIVPLLSQSREYYRGVGYFSSAWLGLAFKGIQELILNNGRIRLLTSPQLSTEDWNAIMNGEKAKTDEVIYKSICKSINEFDAKSKKDILNLFAWLIADGFLEMKFVVCTNVLGNYHDKIAVFKDEDENQICLHGSLNDSLQATFNGECVSVFKGWIPGQAEYLDTHYENLCDLYNNKNSYFEVYDIPNILKLELSKYKTNERPYEVAPQKQRSIQLPHYINELHPYQMTAIESLIANNWRGIFEMATGTGKTITAIEATRRYIEENNRAYIIIVVPFSHLVSQWEGVLFDFGYQNVICCYKGLKQWISTARTATKNYNAKIKDVVCLVTTYKTASTDEFISLAKSVSSGAVLVADECHYIGSHRYSQIMLDNIDMRLGLSATPDRWFDIEGTSLLRQYFDKTVFEYDLRTAIDNHFLTEYKYTPVVVNLSDSELEEYEDLSRKISRLIAYSDEVEKGSAAEILLIKRAAILSRAESKKAKLQDMITHKTKDGSIDHTLVYCANGESKTIVRLLANLNVRVHDFVYDVSAKKRDELLEQFDCGDIEVLVAIKCLDEGVDVPSTQTAYFLASSSNPREFVQRRGRILRKSNDKNKAYLYDFVVMPDTSQGYAIEEMQKIYKSIIAKELPRFAEFAQNALNKYEAHDVLRPYLSALGYDYLLDLKPQEIYEELYHEEYKEFEEGESDE